MVISGKDRIMDCKNDKVVKGLAVAIVIFVGLAPLCMGEVKRQPVCDRTEAVDLLNMLRWKFDPAQMREFESHMQEEMARFHDQMAKFRYQMERMGPGHDLFARLEKELDEDGKRPGRRGEDTKKHGKRGGDKMMGAPGGMIGGGRGGIMGGPGEHGKRWQQHMLERHEEYVKWLKNNYPDEAKRLEKIKKTKPQAYMLAHMDSKKKYGEIMDAEKKRPEWAKVLREDLELKGRRVELLQEYASADARAKKKLKAELKEIVEARFDILVRKKQKRYESLKRRLESLRERVEAQEAELVELQKQKSEATASRMSELIGSAEKIDWD